ncbi:MAG: ATP-grasp domain-containing protein [Geobacteraceae bacterium]
MKKLTVMVTGAGAVLGQGILRSLRMAHLPIRIITADPDYRAAGHWLGDFATIVPMADNHEYLSVVEGILSREQVDLLLIGTDVELLLFSRERSRIEKEYGTRIVVSPPQVIEIANDKLLTARFLEDSGFPYAISASADDPVALEGLVRNCGFPLISKPKQGARSVGVAILHGPDDLARINGRSELLVQELLPDAEGEFTSGCLVVQQRCEATVVLRRDLRDGNTYRAYTDTSGRFEAEISSIAERLGCFGPCNFQFRVRNGRPVIFEINARFSGTTPIRAMLGFNEVVAMVDFITSDKSIPAVSLKDGAVLRAWSDIYVDSKQLESFRQSGTNASPECAEFAFRSL